MHRNVGQEEGLELIRVIIFDFDGLIIDTETPWYKAYKAFAQQYGVELPLELWAHCVGTSFDVFDPIQYIQKHSKQPIEKEYIQKETKELYDSLMKEVTIRPGVRQYLQEAVDRGLRIGLASSSSRRWVEYYLAKHNLLDYFQAISTSDDVRQVKPSPELYIKTMNSLQVSGEETIAFEDSLNGLRAAKSAGALCVVVPNPVTSFLKFEKHDLRLNSMEEMPLHEVIEKLEQSSSLEKQFKLLLFENEILLNDLRIVRSLQLPECYIAAGYIRNYIWDRLHQWDYKGRHNDIDVVYYDPSDLSEERDAQFEAWLVKETGNPKWSVKNQARMHIRNGEEPYASTLDALGRWPETATAIGVKLDESDRLELCAPHGLKDLFQMIVRRSPLFTDQLYYLQRVQEKGWKTEWPMLTIIPD
jgi:uncharacterized protein